MIMLRNDSRALRDGFSMIMLRLYKHVPCMPSSAPSTNQRHQHRRRFIVIVCSRAGSMSWYVVFQVESNDDFLPPDPEPGLRFGHWLKFVRGGRRAWALARRWAVDGSWAECMRVAYPDIRAIRRQARHSLQCLQWYMIAHRTFIRRTSDLQASYTGVYSHLLQR